MTEIPTKHLTIDTAKQELTIALSLNQIFLQRLQTEADKLVFSDDNIPAIKEFIDLAGKAEKIIEKKHKEIKEPALTEGRNIDAAKNALIGLVAAIKNPVSTKYTKMCVDIQVRQAAEAAEEKRKKDILSGIESNVLTFSNMIAAASTNEHLLSVERKINLEKSSSTGKKYGEFHSLAVQRYDEVLIPIIKLQKLKVKEAEAIEALIENATNAEEMEQLTGKHEQVQASIRQNQITVQEDALNQKPIETVSYARTVFPTVKATRTSWDMEILDVEKVFKKSPDLLEICLDKKKAKIVLDELKKSEHIEPTITKEGLKEYIHNGIRYFEKQSW